jgi:hypothetical protein
LLRLGEAPFETETQPDTSVEVEPTSGLPIVERHDISEARGLIHFRQALIGDGSYRWPPPDLETPPPWQWAMLVSDLDRNESYTVLIDDINGFIQGENQTEPIDCGKILGGMELFFKDLGVKP